MPKLRKEVRDELKFLRAFKAVVLNGIRRGYRCPYEWVRYASRMAITEIDEKMLLAIAAELYQAENDLQNAIPSENLRGWAGLEDKDASRDGKEQQPEVSGTRPTHEHP